MELIPNYSLYGFSNDGNVVTAIRDDSIFSKRLDATYTRKTASYNIGTKTYSVPESTVTFRRDTVDGDGAPTGQRMSGSVSFRLPVAASESDLDDLIADVRAYINDTELKQNLLMQLLPTCCASEEE